MPDRLPAHPFDADDDKLREECGIFGVTGVTDAATFVALGLHALQHRGQEAGGIVTHDPALASRMGRTCILEDGVLRDA